jgi:hypothetical protein
VQRGPGEAVTTFGATEQFALAVLGEVGEQEGLGEHGDDPLHSVMFSMRFGPDAHIGRTTYLATSVRPGD